MDMEYDLIIRGGTIADGTGAPLFEGDVAVKDGKIAATGEVTGRAKEEVDATGMLVTPGFVDIHTHYDGQALWEERLIPSSWHGVTTTMFGNCGVGFAPVRKRDQQGLIDLMVGVEDIPENAIRTGLKWNWESFPDYLDALDGCKHDMDICAQLPHAALRLYVMGGRAMKLEPATDKDLAEMRVLAKEAVEAGAFGYTTSRSFNHIDVHGAYTPTLGATEEEFTAIAMGMNDAGRGVIELTANWTAEERQDDLAMWKRVMKASGRPLSYTITQRHHEPDAWQEMLKATEDFTKEGLELRAQIAPRSIGSMYGLQLSRHPFYLHPSFQPLLDAPLEEKVKTMRDPSFRQKLLSEKPGGNNERLAERAFNFKYTFPLGNPPDYEPPKENSIAEMALRQNRSPQDVAYDLVLEDEGRAFLFSPNNNYAAYNLDVVKNLICHPRTCLGLSDGGAHVGHIADSSYPTFVLAYWGRDRKRGTIDLPWLVHWLTGATAALAGLGDRGRLAPGYKADVNIIDFDRLGMGYPYLTYDLPENGKRFMQDGMGYVATYLNGVATYREGKPTDAPLGGRLVRGQQPAPAAA